MPGIGPNIPSGHTGGQNLPDSSVASNTNPSLDFMECLRLFYRPSDEGESETLSTSLAFTFFF